MGTSVRIWLFALIWVLATQLVIAHAEPRVALIIGNEDYPPEVGALANPHEDAELVASALQSVGFELVGGSVVKDGDRSAIWQAVFDFQAALDAGGEEAIGFFYYSGHGGSHEANGRRTNYLLPAKTPIISANQLPALGVSFPDIVAALSGTKAASIFVVSDACRNTLPFTSNRGGAQLDRGFVPIGAAQRMLIAYSTADGETAPDDSKFARALARYIPEKVSADRLFTLVGREVARQRAGGRYPVVSDRLGKDVFLAGVAAPTLEQVQPEPPAAREVRVEVPVLSDDADAAFGSAYREDQLEIWQAFADKFPDYSEIDYVRDQISILSLTNAVRATNNPQTSPLTGSVAAATRSNSNQNFDQIPQVAQFELAIAYTGQLHRPTSRYDLVLIRDVIESDFAALLSPYFQLTNPASFIQKNIDLDKRPRFSDWEAIGANYLVIVDVKSIGRDGYAEIAFRLWDVGKGELVPVDGKPGILLTGQRSNIYAQIEASIVGAIYR
ncbi:MAG: caspase family protein [Pseudomonadota bacterium]